MTIYGNFDLDNEKKPPKQLCWRIKKYEKLNKIWIQIKYDFLNRI